MRTDPRLKTFPPAAMPISHRVGDARFGRRASPPPAFTRLRDLRSGPLMVLVATAFIVLSAIAGLLAPDQTPGRQTEDPVTALRGSLPVADGAAAR